MAVLVGTSGFDYPHWRGLFYPKELKPGDRLAFYGSRFRTLELNVTFYRMPSAAAFRGWAARVDDLDHPSDGGATDAQAGPFLFAVKASRYLTHVKRLKDPKDSVEYLVERASLLGPHLGPYLLQLPPDMEIELERLDETLRAFGRARVAVEPRHKSWFVPEFADLLKERGAALCLADRRGPIAPIWRTADWTYVRFHGSWGGRGSKGFPGYSDSALRAWSERLHETFGAAPDGFAYFNNDARAAAPDDAERFEALLARSR